MLTLKNKLILTLIISLICQISYAINWQNTAIPSNISEKLKKAKISPNDISIVVWDLNSKHKSPILSLNSTTARNPASVMKLVTTYAGLDILGPNYYWRTPIYMNGFVANNTLNGDLIIKGKGDPFLVSEYLWQAFYRLYNMGIHHINGDIILDYSTFDIPYIDPNSFDNEGHKSYNVRPEALLINFKSITATFTPFKDSNNIASHARISYDIPLDGVNLQNRIELDKTSSCGDWRSKIKAVINQQNKIVFSGKYPLSCNVKNFSFAYSQPQIFANKAIQTLWKQVGGSLAGKIITSNKPINLTNSNPLIHIETQPLSQIIRSINKYSNNVMAQQLFLSLPLKKQQSQTNYLIARNFLKQWWINNFPQSTTFEVENGSGLSRSAKVTAQGIAFLLKHAYNSPYMSELMSSLPSIGIDGTLRNKTVPVNGYLKTGTLRNVSSLAGYVQNKNNKYYAFVAIVNGANSANSQIVFDELLKWTAQQK